MCHLLLLTEFWTKADARAWKHNYWMKLWNERNYNTVTVKLQSGKYSFLVCEKFHFQVSCQLYANIKIMFRIALAWLNCYFFEDRITSSLGLHVLNKIETIPIGLIRKPCIKVIYCKITCVIKIGVWAKVPSRCQIHFLLRWFLTSR